LVTATLLVAGAGTPAAASRAQSGGRILYLQFNGATIDTAGQLKSVRPNGSDGQDLGRTMMWYASPDYSPDGSRIAYAESFSIRTLAEDGSDDRWQVDAPCNPAFPRWSPNGRWIAYEACGDIYAVHRDGPVAGRQNLTESDANDLTVAWAPNGRRFATSNYPGIRIYRTDGTGARTLNDLPGAYRLDWSPNGRQLVVEALGDLWLVTAATGAARRITNTPDIQEISPVWSPDGRWIAYGVGPGVHNPDLPGATTSPIIWLMDRQGRNQRSTGIAGVPSSWRSAA
jgi:TolB protein